MAQVLDTATQQVVDVPDEQVTELVASGRALLPKGQVPVVDSRGTTGFVPSEDASRAFAQGFRFRTAAELQAEADREEYEDRPIAAGLAGAARGATLGLSDEFLTDIGAARPETLRGLEDYNQGASIGGEIAGTALVTLGTAGEAAPAAIGERVAAHLGTAAAERLGGRALAREAVKGAVEGGLQGLGRAITDAAQQRDPLTAEKALASTAEGALFGLGTGALFGKGEELLHGTGRATAELAEQAPSARRLEGVGAELPTTPEPPAGAAVEPPTSGVPPAEAAAGEAGGAVPPGGQPPAPLPPPGPPGGGPPDIASIIASGAEATAKPIKEAVEKNPGVFKRVFDAFDVSFPDADEWVLRGLDVKKKGAELLEEKGLLKSAPRALREDARFAQVKNGADAAQLIKTKLGESGSEVRSAAAKLDALVTPEEQLDVNAFVSKAEKELVAPLARGTVDERRAARRLRQELRAMVDGLTPETPEPIIRKAGTYEIPLSELDDISTTPTGKGGAADNVRALYEKKGLKSTEIEPIRIGTDASDPNNLQRTLVDGNHRLAVARERGEQSIRVTFTDDEAASRFFNRPRSADNYPGAVAPMDSLPRPGAVPGKMTFAQAEDLKRRLDKSLRWDSTTPNEIRDQLRGLRGLLNRTQEETAERVSKKVGASTFDEWKRAKTLYSQMAELDNIASERLGAAKTANRFFSLTDNLAGVAGAIAGGGLNPAGLGVALGAAVLNKWGRENLPFIMARAMADFDGNPGIRKAAQSLVNRLRNSGEGGAGGAAAAPRPSTSPVMPGGGSAAQAPMEQAMKDTLQRAAQQGPRETWLTHTILSGIQEYRSMAEREGLADYRTEADAEGAKRAAAMGRVEAAAARFDAKANAATAGLLSGKRPRVAVSRRDSSLRSAAKVLAAAKDPDALVSRIASRLTNVGAEAPGLASDMQEVAQRAQAFLASKAPAPPVSPLGDVPALRRPWKPSDVELARWTAYVRAVENPASVLEDAAGGRLAPESVEALSAVYPALLEDLRGRVVGKLASHRTPLPYAQRVALGQLLGMQLDESMRPGFIAQIQALHQQQPEKPQSRPSASSAQAQKRLASEFSASDALTERNV